MRGELPDIVKELAIAVVSGLPRRRTFEQVLRAMAEAYRVLYVVVRKADDEYQEYVRGLFPPVPEVERRKRAKPYRPAGMKRLGRIRVPGMLTDGKRQVRG